MNLKLLRPKIDSSGFVITYDTSGNSNIVVGYTTPSGFTDTPLTPITYFEEATDEYKELLKVFPKNSYTYDYTLSDVTLLSYDSSGEVIDVSGSLLIFHSKPEPEPENQNQNQNLSQNQNLNHTL